MEKIKVSLSKNVYDILIKDCELFEFFKSDGSLNKNLFLNTLIINYYQEYTNEQENLKTKFSQITQKYFSLKDLDEINLINELANSINKVSEKGDHNETIIVSFKPIRSSLKIIEYLETVVINNQSISSFFRNLFTSYTHKIITNREKIIFKENYDTLLQALNSHKQIYFTTTKSQKVKEASIYALASSKDELFNYVLIQEGTTPYSIRLSRMKNIIILPTLAKIDKDNLPLYNKAIEYAPQYMPGKNENEEIIIRLTPNGEKLYKSIYLYRPKYIKKENDIYTFNCSYIQIINYFSRLGKDAIILSPLTLKKRMFNYYKSAYFTYKEGNSLKIN